MAEKIEVGVIIKSSGKAISDLNQISSASKNVAGELDASNLILGKLEGSFDQMTGGAYSGFKKAAGGLKTFITGLKTTKSAIVATGIGALVVAFGLLVTHWDDIKELVSGVSSEQKNLLRDTIATRDASQAQLDITRQSEEILRLAGKSEQAILDTKIEQSLEIVEQTRDILEQQKLLKIEQIAGAQRNKEIAAGILQFMMIPLNLILGAVDALTAGLAFIGVLEEGTSLVEDSADFMASQFFDPEEVEKEADATILAIENELLNMENTYAGYQNKKIANDEAAAKREREAAATRASNTATAEQEEIDTQKAIDDAKIAAQIKLEDELYALSLSAKEREELALQQKYDERAAIAEGNEALEKDAKQQYYDDLEALQNKYDEASTAAQNTTDDKTATDKKASDDKKIAQELAVADAIKAARMTVVSSSFDALNAMAKTEEQSKKLAIAQILVNQAIAMSQAIAGATTSATATGPGAFVATPLFIAQSLGIVLGSFASIKGVLNQAGAATEGVGDEVAGGGAGGAGIASNREGPTLGLTPDISKSLSSGSMPPVNAYVVQSQLADQNALAAQIQAASTL